MYRYAIIGSRSFTDYKLFCNKLQNIITIAGAPALIASGGARGADQLAARYAFENRITLQEYKPEWEKYGTAAGLQRNTLIIENSDVVVAFWDYGSKGTKDSIAKAVALNTNTFVVNTLTKAIEHFQK
jgi:hypothetical protein